MAQDIARVYTAPRGLTSGSDTLVGVNPSGAAVVMDFLTHSLINGHGFQVRAGTITTPLTGDVLITDAAAEFCADAAAGLVMIPTRLNVDIEALGGTLPQVTCKMVATASTAGAAFVPLPLLQGGRAAATTARVAAAGGVTVTAELATTTKILYYSTQAAVGNWEVAEDLLGTGIANGAACVYVQVGSVTTGSNYFGTLSYLEFTTSALGLS